MGKTTLSDFLQNDKTSVAKRSPYHEVDHWKSHTLEGAFGHEVIQEIQGMNYNTVNRAIHYNPELLRNIPQEKLRLPPDVEEALKMGGFKERFECYNDPQMVSAISYDRERMLLQISWVKPRTGKRKGVPPGTATIYDHVPPNVYEYLEKINTLKGHVGHEVWKIIKGKYPPHALYMYTNRESEV